MDRTSKQRKRDATGKLRSLAEEVGLTPIRNKTDLPLAEFMALHDEVSSTACTPEQQQRVQQAAQCAWASVCLRARAHVNVRARAQLCACVCACLGAVCAFVWVVMLEMDSRPRFPRGPCQSEPEGSQTKRTLALGPS